MLLILIIKTFTQNLKICLLSNIFILSLKLKINLVLNFHNIRNYNLRIIFDFAVNRMNPITIWKQIVMDMWMFIQMGLVLTMVIQMQEQELVFGSTTIMSCK